MLSIIIFADEMVEGSGWPIREGARRNVVVEATLRRARRAWLRCGP